MSVAEILDYFNDINTAYNESGRYDSLKRMLEELQEEMSEAMQKACRHGFKQGYEAGYKNGYENRGRHFDKEELKKLLFEIEEGKKAQARAYATWNCGNEPWLMPPADGAWMDL